MPRSKTQHVRRAADAVDRAQEASESMRHPYERTRCAYERAQGDYVRAQGDYARAQGDYVRAQEALGRAQDAYDYRLQAFDKAAQNPRAFSDAPGNKDSPKFEHGQAFSHSHNNMVSSQQPPNTKKPPSQGGKPKVTNMPKIKPAARRRPTPSSSEASDVEGKPLQKTRRISSGQQLQELPPYDFTSGSFDKLPKKYQAIYHKRRGPSSPPITARPIPFEKGTEGGESARRLSIAADGEGSPSATPQGVGSQSDPFVLTD